LTLSSTKDRLFGGDTKGTKQPATIGTNIKLYTVSTFKRIV